MSLQMHPIGPVPEETERVARSSFPKSNIYLRIRDELGAIYDDETFRIALSEPRTIGFLPVALGNDHRDTVCGEPVRPAGS